MRPKTAKIGKTTVRSLAVQRSPIPAAAFERGEEAKQPAKNLRGGTFSSFPPAFPTSGSRHEKADLRMQRAAIVEDQPAPSSNAAKTDSETR